MAKVSSITEHYQHFLRESKEGFWGDLYGPTQLAWKGFFELQSERERDRYSGAGRYERQAYGVRTDGTRHLLGFLRSPGESQSAGEGLLQDLYRPGLSMTIAKAQRWSCKGTPCHSPPLLANTFKLRGKSSLRSKHQ